MKRKELPTDDHLKTLPRWARVALVARSMRRVMPLVFKLLPDAPKQYWQMLETAISCVEQTAAEGSMHPNLLRIWNRLSNSHCVPALKRWSYSNSIMEYRASEVMQAAEQVTLAAWSAKVESVAEALDDLRFVVESFQIEFERNRLDRQFIEGVWRDFDKLAALRSEQKWSNLTAVSTNVFDEMWPQGIPQGWSTEHRVAKTLPFSLKSPTNTKDIAALPKDLVAFLEKNPDYEIRARGSECGPIVLNRLEYLELSQHEFSMTSSDWADEDPNRRIPGSYILNTVELVCFCEHYSTNGLLSWFIDYECFGCYDDDHGSVNLFLGANWNDILARPNFFIGSQWNGPTKPIVQLTNPWERLKFRKAKPPKELVPILKALHAIDRAFSPKAFAYLSDLIRQYFKSPDSGAFEKLSDAYENLMDSELHADLLKAIACRCLDQGEPFVRELMLYFKSTKDDFDACRLAEAMLGLCFEKAKRYPIKAGLSSIQREVLTCLLRRKILWSREPELSELMKERGLPDSHSQLEKFLKEID
ncbi:MAG: hypothetical protein SFV81_14525 [Pirellulaceae bacterium]|nr:hypothetical protein [Pirellulaceae bacterium]